MWQYVMKEDRRFYVYVWYKEGEPFYVGKGCRRNRAYRNKDEGIDVEIYKNNLTETEAFDLEKVLIAEYGRLDKGEGTLTNLTDGGGLAFASLFWEKGSEIKKRHTAGMKRRYQDEQNRKKQAELCRRIASERPRDWQDSIYLVRSPDGDIRELKTQELRVYCKENKLSERSLKHLGRGGSKFTRGPHVGYFVEQLYNKVTGKTQSKDKVIEMWDQVL